MEKENKVVASSSSSFKDLFATTKDKSASASSSAIFDTIFPPKEVPVTGSLHSEAYDKKQDAASKTWNAKPGASVCVPQSKEGESQILWNKDMSSYHNEQNVQPCHLSSSIYYGGQEIYSSPQTTKSSGYSTFKKDVGEDNSGSDTRENWWQGGVYY